MNKVFNYSHYKGLGFANFESWSEDDLAQFLILDLINGLGNTNINKDMPKRFTDIYHSFFERSVKYQNIFRFIDRILLKFVSLFKDKNKEKILFVRSNTFAVLGAKKQYSLKFITWGKLDRLFAIIHLMGYIDTGDLVKYVFYYLKERKIEYLRTLLTEVESKLKTIRPNYIVLSNDSLPIERAIILVSKKMGIITMEIQHGIYAKHLANPMAGKESTSPLYNGQAADYVLVWGEYFKNLYTEQGTRNPDDIYIFGYRFPIKKNKKAKNKRGNYTICYLAQDYETYNKDFLEIKLETIKKLSETCKRLNLKFICRPHPHDNRKKLIEELPEVYFTPENEQLAQAFERSDVLISFDSTSLTEGSMKGKICLQLMSYPIKTDNFEQLGVCSKSFENIADLEVYLEKISKSTNLNEFKIKFNNKYIETRYNPGQRFLEILNEIKTRTHI